MSQPSPTSTGGPAVSKSRTVVSLILLLIVGVICLIELRAGLGHFLTAKALKEKCNQQDEFENLTLQDAQALVRFSTSVEEQPSDADTSFRYTWYSLLRPLMGDESPGLTLVATKGEKPMALSFHTDSAEEPATNSPEPPAASSSSGGMMVPGGPGGGMMSPGGPGGMMPGGPGGPGGGRRERPPVEDDTPDTAAPAEGSNTEKPADGAPADQPAADKPAEDKPAETPTDKPADPPSAPN